MKANILPGVAALFVLVLMMAPAVATTDRLTALGKVTDWNGNPVQGADVTLIDDSFRTLGATTTDALGDFRFIDVNLSDSSYVKARVSYVHTGQTYTVSLENVRWNDASGGLINIDLKDTRLYNYPPGDQGYVWGVVLDSLVNGKVMDSTVYLKGNTRMFSVDTSAAGMGSFQLHVPTGDYEIYAVHGQGRDRLVSNHTMIHVYPSYELLQSAPIDLIVDQKDSGRPVQVILLAAALSLGLGMIIAAWALLGRRQ
jgi:hypothetical protein